MTSMYIATLGPGYIHIVQHILPRKIRDSDGISYRFRSAYGKSK